MMNRRNILSTLSTGTLALLAPVMAWAKPRRWVGFHNRGVKPMVITMYKDLTPEQIAEFKRLWRTSTIPPPRTLAEAFAAHPHAGEPETREIDAPARQEWILPKPLGKENAELRALLAEARDLLTPVVPFKRKDGTLANFTQVHADDITDFVRRANAALK